MHGCTCLIPQCGWHEYVCIFSVRTACSICLLPGLGLGLGLFITRLKVVTLTFTTALGSHSIMISIARIKSSICGQIKAWKRTIPLIKQKPISVLG